MFLVLLVSLILLIQCEQMAWPRCCFSLFVNSALSFSIPGLFWKAILQRNNTNDSCLFLPNWYKIRSIFCVWAGFPLLPTYWTTQTTCLSTRFCKPRKITEIIFARISVTGIGRSYYSTWRIMAIYRTSHFIDLNKNTIYCINIYCTSHWMKHYQLKYLPWVPEP